MAVRARVKDTNGISVFKITFGNRQNSAVAAASAEFSAVAEASAGFFANVFRIPDSSDLFKAVSHLGIVGCSVS